MTLPPVRGKVLLLHGWWSDGSLKSLTISGMGYKVETPKLSDWAFNIALITAQKACEGFNPDVIVGSSRGAAVAMNLHTNKPLVLLAPAWKRFGRANFVNPQQTVIIHSPNDSIVPYENSVELCRRSPGLRLITVGEDHRLNDQEASKALCGVLAAFMNKKDFLLFDVDVFQKPGRLPLSMWE